MHADFQSAWDPPSLLQSVIDQCHADNADGDIRHCPPLHDFIDETARDACQIDVDIRVPNEDVGLFHGNILSVLPGNNPLWPEGGSKPVNDSFSQTSSWGRVGSLWEGVGGFGSQHFANDSSADGSFDWEIKGCIAEASTGRALEAAQIMDEAEMSLKKCAMLCQTRGYHLSGVEFG